MATDSELDEVAAALGWRVASTEVVAWGDAAATTRVDLIDGRIFALRRMRTSHQADRLVTIMERAANAGIPVPSATPIETMGAAWVVTPWTAGRPGAAWLDPPRRALQLAESMGALIRRMRAVEATDLGSDLEAATQPALARRTGIWLAAVQGELDQATVAAIQAARERLAATPPERPAFVHGDFAPINVIVDATGQIAALLDFEDARLGPPLTDVAWWGWVVRHHHPDAWAATWSTFRRAAGVDPGSAPDAEIRAIQLARLVESVATATDLQTRSRWLDRLTATAAW